MKSLCRLRAEELRGSLDLFTDIELVRRPRESCYWIFKLAHDLLVDCSPAELGVIAAAGRSVEQGDYDHPSLHKLHVRLDPRLNGLELLHEIAVTAVVAELMVVAFENCLKAGVEL
jgi:hypothetical protein